MPILKKKSKKKLKREGSSVSTPGTKKTMPKTPPKGTSGTKPKSTSGTKKTTPKSKRKRPRLPLLTTENAALKELQKIELQKIKDEVLTKLNHMNHKDVQKLYSEIGTLDRLTITSFIITPKFVKDNSQFISNEDLKKDLLDKLTARGIVQINSITIGRKEKKFKKLYFFKSSGSSRPDDKIKDIYFPINYLPSVDITGKEDIYLFQKEHTGVRIKKPEDYYKFIFENLSLAEYLSQKEKFDALKNQLLKYGRFITEENALISKYLSKL